MFIIILITLRASGKRGIKQLSIFELVLIIGLGSAAGDPMFYEDVGLLSAITVFLVIILLYIGITKLTDKFTWLERLLEGKATYLLRDGEIILDAFKNSSLSRDDFFAELRLLNVEHLGQVQTVLIETSGEFSVLYFSEEKVRPGLTIFPHMLESQLTDNSTVACYNCGRLCSVPAGEQSCVICECDTWVIPMETKRQS
ncbi:DUF421 domain-containing protein [Pedobacter hartonius]|uniref:Uncharacterized membrane protein YcaP, DUF421 family n=1 Tax=Pedobacter hartonius TaxID=425514 RepID=A0A1H4HB55_9SPHI|nr:YetF domain-containing protein [Pedobacter hartonius]SEB18288.1 Uncharacterized membrane protein YcaP, DUF421 family [Pedobacter hartonius]